LSRNAFLRVVGRETAESYSALRLVVDGFDPRGVRTRPQQPKRIRTDRDGLAEKVQRH
jgi:hypothetical protein